jgi:amidase
LNLSSLDATAQAKLVRDGEVTPVDLVEAAIARIEEVEPILHALVDTRFEAALLEARNGLFPDGAFKGVPMLIKDAVQHSKGDRYQHGLTFLRDHEYRSTEDSALVSRYRAAGFIILGRTKVPELTTSATTAPRAFGPAHNPWDIRRSPGGSSGGSAVAVASGMVPVAHGNDMGGSIRIPASCCGLVGLKPSRHRTSDAPHGEYWGPLTHEHVLTRSVRDSAGVLDHTAGAIDGDLHLAPPPTRPWLDEVGAPSAPLHFGLILDHPFGKAVDPECREATQAVARVLEELGHLVEPVGSAVLCDNAGTDALGVVVCAGLAAEVARWERHFGQPVTNLEPLNIILVERGRAITGTELMEAIDELARWSREICKSYRFLDGLITPTLPVIPPMLREASPSLEEAAEEGSAFSAFVLPFDVTGQPAISLPTYWSRDGLPVGVQIVGPYGREDLLFQVAGSVEQAVPWAHRLPAMTR